MEIPEMRSIKDQAVDIVAFVLNKAIDKLGYHRSINELSLTKDQLNIRPMLSLDSIKPPIAINSEKFIKDSIERKWMLTNSLKYHLQFKGCSTEEISKYYYFEVIFSQPTPKYPIPQATASVFFRVQIPKMLKYENPPPVVTFRLEGHYTDHDVRYVALIQDWILAILKMKLKLFKRIEGMYMF